MKKSPTPAKAYLVKHKLDKSVWGKKIIQAEMRGKFTLTECERADRWPDCACGKISPEIPRDAKGIPHDGELYTMGVHFSSNVANAHFLEAAQCLYGIEARAQLLLSKGES